MAVKNRLAELIAIKARQEERGRISNREIAEVLGISPVTVNRYVNNEITRFDSDTVQKLCDYLDCSIGELLYLDADETPESKPSLLAVS